MRVYLADENTPHTADIVEPSKCASWFCTRHAVAGYYYCREHLAIGAPIHNRRGYPTDVR